MQLKPEIHVIDINDPDHFTGNTSVLSIDELDSKPTAALWGAFDENIIIGHDDGRISNWDNRVPTKKLIELNDVHRGRINDMQYNIDQTMFITASKDTTAKVLQKIARSSRILYTVYRILS